MAPHWGPGDGEDQVLVRAVEIGGAQKVCGQHHSAPFFEGNPFADHVREDHVYAADGDVKVPVDQWVHAVCDVEFYQVPYALLTVVHVGD